MIQISDKEFKQLSEYIHRNYGIHLKEEKQTMVMGRLYNVLQKNNMCSFTDYYDYVVSDNTGNAAAVLLNKITTNHTFFMREAEHFEYFKSRVLPQLAEKIRDNDLRIWSAGCSSGEEPYTLAMLIDEFFGAAKRNWDTRVLATDISDKVLDKARKGEYENERLGSVPKYWMLNYFRKVHCDRSAVNDKIRNEVIFRKLNLMDEVFPFKKKFHVIFCRNVMIYFDNKTKTELVNKFYDLTEPGGYLFIGHSESLKREETSYKYIMPAVYRKV